MNPTVFPDSSVAGEGCRATRKKAGGFVYCLVPNARGCPFGEQLDNSQVCCHPKREDIVIRTNAKGPDHPSV